MSREEVIEWLRANGFRKTTKNCWNRGSSCLVLKKFFCNYRVTEKTKWIDRDVIAEFNLLEDNTLEQRDGWFTIPPKETENDA